MPRYFIFIIFSCIVSFFIPVRAVDFGPIVTTKTDDGTLILCQCEPPPDDGTVIWEFLDGQQQWVKAPETSNPITVNQAAGDIWRCSVVVDGHAYYSWSVAVGNQIDQLSDTVSSLSAELSGRMTNLELDLLDRLTRNEDVFNVLIHTVRDELLDEISGNLNKTRHLYDRAVVELSITKSTSSGGKSFRQSGALVRFKNDIFIISTRHGISKKVKRTGTEETYYCLHEIHGYNQKKEEFSISSTGHFYHKKNDIALLRVGVLLPDAHVWELSKEKPTGDFLVGVSLFEGGDDTTLLRGYVKRSGSSKTSSESLVANYPGIPGFSGSAYISRGYVVAIHRGDGTDSMESHEMRDSEEPTQKERESVDNDVVPEESGSDFTADERLFISEQTKQARRLVDIVRTNSRNPQSELIPTSVLYEEDGMQEFTICEI